ncbi:ABC transporter ATP-binding protein [Magnetococcales bacterium HHB-1]
MLAVQNLNMRFGGIQALNQISFDVQPNQITALIGPNGAGKTTVFNCVTGFYHPTSGSVRFSNAQKSIDIIEILGQRLQWKNCLEPKKFLRRLYYQLFGGSHQVTRAGIARTFQNVRLFRAMTVMENLLVAQHQQVNRNLLAGVFQTKAYRQSEKKALERATYWLRELDLIKEADRLAGELPYGMQRRLEIARALCTKPALLCLDEPAAGLNPIETKDLSALIERLCQNYKMTILLIEHDMSLVMNISDHIVVIDHGEVIAAGPPAMIQKNERVLAAYLGSEEET